MWRSWCPRRAREGSTGKGRGAGLDDTPSTTRTQDAAGITSGRPGPPGAARPAGSPILTCATAIGAVGLRVAPSRPSTGHYRGSDALPGGPPARLLRGPARTPRRRPLPLARGRRRPAYAGLERGGGRPRRGGSLVPSPAPG